MVLGRRDRMWNGDCPHATWRVLMHTEDDGTPPVGTCPQGCVVELHTIEPRPT